MVSYVATRLGITPTQIRKVLEGHRIQIAPQHVGTGHVFHLSKVQHNKLRRHVTQGKGMRVQFTPHQIRHNMRHGKGFFDVVKSIGSKLLPVLKAVGKPLAEKALEAGLSRYGPKGDTAKSIVGSIAKEGLKHAFGGRVRVGMGKRRKGGSFRAIGRSGGRVIAYNGGSFRPSGRGISGGSFRP